VIIYKRHKEGCQYKGKDRNQSHRCQCSIYVEWNVSGKQNVMVVRDATSHAVSSWSDAEKIVAQNAKTGNPSTPPVAASAVTIAEASQQFIDSKESEGNEKITIAKYKLTLDRLKDYCAEKSVTLLEEITSGLLLTWFDTQEQWSAASSRLSFHARMKTFFIFCTSRELISKNPMVVEAFRQNVRRYSKDAKKRRQETISPLDAEQVEKLLAACATTPRITAANRSRIHALMLLQRYSGLALVDASCLERDELTTDGKVYRVKTNRQKSDEPVDNVIQTFVAEELLKVKNGNPKYFFWTGESLPGSVSSHYDKIYRKVFQHAGIETNGQLSHRFRHTFAVELLKAGVDIRTVSKALGHSSVTTTERYYAKWNKAQQEMLDDDLTGAWGK